MPLININEVMHRIRCKLYVNYLPNAVGAYHARTNNELSLSIEQVCAALKNRGGFTGSYETLIENVKQFFDETAYQLCDGYAVNTGYYTVYPNVGGTFESANETHDHKTHPVGFRFRSNAKLREIARHIAVEIEGLSDCHGYIDEFRDIDEDSINEGFVPGNQFSISGHKIRIEGDDPAVGLFFVPVDDPSREVRVTRIAENTGIKIIGMVPNTGYERYRVEIRTQFSGTKANPLKTPRVITGNFTIERLRPTVTEG